MASGKRRKCGDAFRPIATRPANCPRMAAARSASRSDAAMTASACSRNACPDYLDKYRELIALIGYTPEQLAAEFSLPIRIRPLRWRIQ
jgi:hypothetical protein